jgi:hypothetical protein
MWNKPEGTGEKGRLQSRSGAGSAGNCDPQTAAMLTDWQRGGPRQMKRE